MKKPELVIGYLMNGGAFIQSIKVPKLLDWIKHLESEELIAFFQDLLELVIQIPRGKEDVETLEEFLGYWRELALESDSVLGEIHADPEEAEIAAKAADILWKSLADSLSAAMSTGELGIFRNYLVFFSSAITRKDFSKILNSGLLDLKEYRLPILLLIDWIALGHSGKWLIPPRNSSGKISDSSVFGPQGVSNETISSSIC